MRGPWMKYSVSVSIHRGRMPSSPPPGEGFLTSFSLFFWWIEDNLTPVVEVAAQVDEGRRGRYRQPHRHHQKTETAIGLHRCARCARTESDGGEENKSGPHQIPGTHRTAPLLCDVPTSINTSRKTRRLLEIFEPQSHKGFSCDFLSVFERYSFFFFWFVVWCVPPFK